MPPDLGWLFRWSFVANLAVAAWVMLGICASFAWVLNRLEAKGREAVPAGENPPYSAAGGGPAAAARPVRPNVLVAFPRGRMRHTGARGR